MRGDGYFSWKKFVPTPDPLPYFIFFLISGTQQYGGGGFLRFGIFFKGEGGFFSKFQGEGPLEGMVLSEGLKIFLHKFT